MDETALRIMQLHAQGYCCSQIMIKLSLDDMGEENPALVRAMAGLCEGSSCGDLCGVASGAACVLSLYAAKGSDEEQPLDCYPIMLSQFMDWFKSTATEWGGIRCNVVVPHRAPLDRSCVARHHGVTDSPDRALNGACSGFIDGNRVPRLNTAQPSTT